MEAAFNTVLPVITLLLGAGLGNYLKLSELNKRLRLDAADQLADLTPFMWDATSPDAWLRFNVAVSRLAIRLNLAGLHPDLVARVKESVEAFLAQRSLPSVRDDDGEV